MTITAHNAASENGRVSAYSFTGKEKDSLRLNPQSGGLCGARLTSPPDLFTRFYYLGARYYNPSLSGLFLSVDPMADKYPSISPYAQLPISIQQYGCLKVSQTLMHKVATIQNTTKKEWVMRILYCHLFTN